MACLSQSKICPPIGTKTKFLVSVTGILDKNFVIIYMCAYLVIVGDCCCWTATLRKGLPEDVQSASSLNSSLKTRINFKFQQEDNRHYFAELLPIVDIEVLVYSGQHK